MDLVILIGVPVFMLYTVVLLAYAHHRGYRDGFDTAMHIFGEEEGDTDGKRIRQNKEIQQEM